MKSRKGLKENEKCIVAFNCAGYCATCIASIVEISDRGKKLIRTGGSNYVSLGD